MTESPQTIKIRFESTMDTIIDALESVQLFKAILDNYVRSSNKDSADPDLSELYNYFRPGGIVTAAIDLHKQMEAAEDLITRL